MWRSEVDLGVFLNHSPPYVLRRSLSPNQELVSWAGLVDQQVPSPSNPPRSASAVLGSQTHAVLPRYLYVGSGEPTQALIKSCKHFPSSTISPAPPVLCCIKLFSCLGTFCWRHYHVLSDWSWCPHQEPVDDKWIGLVLELQGLPSNLCVYLYGPPHHCPLIVCSKIGKWEFLGLFFFKIPCVLS